MSSANRNSANGNHRRQSQWMALGIVIAVGASIVCALAWLDCLKRVERPMRRNTPELFDSGVPRDQSALLASYFKTAAERARKIVLNPPGGTQASQDFRRAWAAGHVKQLDRILSDLHAASGAWVGKNIPAAYRQGKSLGDKQAKEAGVDVTRDGIRLKGDFTTIDQRAVIVLAHDTLSRLNTAADSVIDRAKGVLRATAQSGLTAAEINELVRTGRLSPREGETHEQMQQRLAGVSENQINEVLAQGIISGSPRTVIRELTDVMRRVHGDEVEIVAKNGMSINYPVEYYAEMCARTKTREATVEARHERLQQVGLDLVAIVGRISNNFCSAFLGQVFSLSGNDSKYPSYASLPDGGPPFHPWCSKSTRPFVVALASGRQLQQADGLADAAALLGKDTAKAQRLYKDLQLHTQVREHYAHTASQLFGSATNRSGSKVA